MEPFSCNVEIVRVNGDLPAKQHCEAENGIEKRKADGKDKEGYSFIPIESGNSRIILSVLYSFVPLICSMSTFTVF
jgi:hypothetical protein